MRYPVLVSASMLAVAALATAPVIAGAQTTKDKIEDKAEKTGDKVKGAMERAGDKVQTTGDKLQEKADRAGEKIKGTVDSALDKTSGAASTASDKTAEAGDSAGGKAKSVAREAKTGLSDSWLTAKTKIALFADERVKGRQISVETQKGAVMLRGKVDNNEAKTAAESIAQGIDGVRSVKNELQVVAPSQRAAVEATDKDIQKAVEAKLAADPQLKKIDARADAQVVTLTGEAPGIGASARASELARSVPGVRAVKNDVALPSEASGTMRAARSDQHVKLAQQALSENGINPGPIDGVMGPQTAAALRTYQGREKLPVTGRADAETLARLGVGVGGGTMRTAPSK